MLVEHTHAHAHAAFRRKLEALAKEKECELVGVWIKSLVNHIYWSAVSTPSGDGSLIKAKWLSITNHIHNTHTGHSDLFPSCEHPPIPRRGRRKKWFKLRKLLFTYAFMYQCNFYVCDRHQG